MRQLAYTVIEKLADGQFHSGETLASALGVTRASVWKAVKAAQNELGLEVHCIRGRGYRLAEPLELLSAQAIAAKATYNAKPLNTEVYFELDSTNDFLLQRAKQTSHPRVVFAERQTAGRGRRGRHWVSPISGNLYFSLSWQSGLAPAALSGLSLAVGVALCDVLKTHLRASPKLKWPNDIVIGERKLGGVLVDLIAEAHGPTLCIIGVGLNVHIPNPAGAAIDQPWIDMRSLNGARVSRNELAAELVAGLLGNLQHFEHNGIRDFTGRWEEYDLCHGRTVTLQLPQSTVQGIAAGIDEDGALLLERGGQIERHHSGEVSLRIGTEH